MNNLQQVWRFLASVKLALFTLISLSLTSIIGTVIPQNKPFAFYIEEYGAGLARIFHVLDIPNMYYSWWFLGLLGLLCLNLIVCSIDRFPLAWKQITADQTAVSRQKLETMRYKELLPAHSALTGSMVETLLRRRGWSVELRTLNSTTLITGQKGRWSRLGVYLVHGSILIIFAGALVGSFFGYKGGVMIPETKQSGKIFSSKDQQAIDLGFEVRCDRFDIEFYDNGMVSEYRSRLTVLENGQETLTTEIEVNKPLTYRGITFYQSSYEGYRDFLITLVDSSSGTTTTIVAPFQKQASWEEENLQFGIINAEALRDRVVRMKVWVRAGTETPETTWLKPDEEMTINAGGKQYTLTTKQMYATGLQVAKDPGVWLVYAGCGLMLAGLYLAFFLSHRRIWVLLEEQGPGQEILIAGSANKNQIGFAKIFAETLTEIGNTGAASGNDGAGRET